MTYQKKILITGTSSGIGYSTALGFARKGFIVYAGVRNIHNEDAKKLLSIGQKENLSLSLCKLDITDDSDIKNNEKIYEDLDILVNNAGFGFLGAAEDFTLEEIQKQFDVNFFGTIRMIKAVLPSMRKRKNGKIITISSINGLIPFPLYSVYSSSKFALETFCEALRFEVHPFNISVSLIEPGVFLTNFTKNNKFPQKQGTADSAYNALTRPFFYNFRGIQQAKELSFLTPLLNPQRVANKIMYVASLNNPKTRYIVGVDAHILYFLKQWVPEGLQTFILRKIYKW